ncbi:hypothetical protein MM1S1540310_2397 [Mycobacteroides abscessus subsp. bolletii 1S-154-0310]|uniref:Uncharacterized protein n=1 Tax=Mycobacteroides abscessus MAB_091912_2446 TaxID=1335414 RepID=A0A829MI49_9MYCO|nr:hypothetical protein MYCMA_07760 [Mycobacteroides abscessus subsp. massiliense str. GO 06]EIU62506.1 hypothetical protein MM1S1510930_2843 [Mycobacteroides abscessus subsp. bolletii 1S-151-0930]EIU70135.1 hypothetical protein MM1S1520914_3047 [Mycobacteroides abscessus subsp. bolletii 1S-152-0914]EIU75404.1 hypothetical protein MM1S1530915_2386 [Mycobacteroides abscessus subsp. bolletii 1S-153-0915]EIU80070.1 hypothetical protein MM1S1540310_2397 [Mycobacteroides abscessus subsp. bolletii 1S
MCSWASSSPSMAFMNDLALSMSPRSMALHLRSHNLAIG